MAITQRGSVTQGAYNGGQWMGIDYPSGVVSGDICLAIFGIRSGGTVVSTPSGWTQLIRANNLTHCSVDVYYRVATGSLSGTVQWQYNYGMEVGFMVAYDGVDNSTPFDETVDSANFTTNTSTNNIAAPSITTVTNGALLFACHVAQDYGNSNPWYWSTPSGMTVLDEQYHTQSSATLTCQGCSELRSSAGSTGTRSSTAGTTYDYAAALAFALRPGEQTISVNQSSETDTSQPIAKQKYKAIGQASETDSSQAITENKSNLLLKVSETDQAFSIGIGQPLNVAQAYEIDSAQKIYAPGTLRSWRSSQEFDQALKIQRALKYINANGALTDSESDLYEFIKSYNGQFIYNETLLKFGYYQYTIDTVATLPFISQELIVNNLISNYILFSNTDLSNNVYIQDAEWLKPNYQLSIRVLIGLNDYTPSDIAYIVHKYNGYKLYIDTNGKLNLDISGDSVTNNYITSDVLPFMDGEYYWLRVDWEQDVDGISVASVFWSESLDDPEWILIQNIENAQHSIEHSASPLYLGGTVSGNAMDGYLGAIKMYGDNEIIADYDFTLNGNIDHRNNIINDNYDNRLFIVGDNNRLLPNVVGKKAYAYDDNVGGKLLVANEPLFLSLNAQQNNYLYTQIEPSNVIINDITIYLKVSLDYWIYGLSQTFVAQWSGGNKNWLFGIDGSGDLYYKYSTDGSAEVIKTIASSTIFVDGHTYWIKVTHDVDNGASGNDVIFYYALNEDIVPDGRWMKIGSTQTTAGAVTRYESTSNIEIGSNSGGSDVAGGVIYYVIIEKGVV